MSSLPLVPILTRAGLAALSRAQGDGLQATIVSAAVGIGQVFEGADSGYPPYKTQTSLLREVARVPILSGTRLDPAGLRILVTIPAEAGPAEFAIHEVGFFLETGEMLAVWSDPAGPLAFKTARADVDIAFDLLLDQIPTDLITFSVLPPDIPDTTGVLAMLLATSADLFIGQMTDEWRFPLRPRQGISP